ncbi:3-oxoacid CoA-transferase subunit B [Lacrimispora sp.]|uniref:3-oxoacid CoA-transferase subunit B n=1 Tax=Lacrimispora sp. TaxID=2719234 RepID=UPI00289A71B9|nr:3-oxoacid CoA-transferase subunit B [Lacrimispora sp.]
MSVKERIVKRVAKELQDGDVVNLGIGMPTMVADYIAEGMTIHLQSENGILGMGPVPQDDSYDRNIVNAGGKPVTVENGACYFDSADSFVIIRGGHVDMTVLGALQVDQRGSLASHIIPGRMVPGMGGAMDLVTGSKKVIVAMTHTAKDGSAKILSELTLPATAVARVHKIVTELAVIDVTQDGLVLREVAEGTTVDEVVKKTGAPLLIPASVTYF